MAKQITNVVTGEVFGTSWSTSAFHPKALGVMYICLPQDIQQLHFLDDDHFLHVVNKSLNLS